MLTGIEVAHYVVDKCYQMDKPITNLHLQKILYFVQGGYYQKTGEMLIEDDFLAWQYGPVIESVYDQYSWNCASRLYYAYDQKLDESITNIIDPIIEDKRKQTARSLVDQTHKPGGAWKSVYDGRKSTIIPKKYIEREFGSQCAETITSKTN